MKLTATQIAEINKRLSKDDLFYDDIRDEMTDHIATTLEQQMDENSDFGTVLNDYMNSHLKVKLLTAARHQEILRDKMQRNLLLKQFVTTRGIVFFTIICSIVLLSTYEVWAFRFFQFLLMIVVFSTMLSGIWMTKRFIFLKRIHDVSVFYHLIPVLFVLQIYRLTGETPFINIVCGIIMSIIFTIYYLAARMNNQLLKGKRYA